jgi:hypothetical protein
MVTVKATSNSPTFCVAHRQILCFQSIVPPKTRRAGKGRFSNYGNFYLFEGNIVECSFTVPIFYYSHECIELYYLDIPKSYLNLPDSFLERWSVRERQQFSLGETYGFLYLGFVIESKGTTEEPLLAKFLDVKESKVKWFSISEFTHALRMALAKKNNDD